MELLGSADHIVTTRLSTFSYAAHARALQRPCAPPAEPPAPLPYRYPHLSHIAARTYFLLLSAPLSYRGPHLFPIAIRSSLISRPAPRPHTAARTRWVVSRQGPSCVRSASSQDGLFVADRVRPAHLSPEAGRLDTTITAVMMIRDHNHQDEDRDHDA